jgi:hypothetical protein
LTDFCNDCGMILTGDARPGTCPECVRRLHDSLARACEVPRVAQKPDRSRRLVYLAWAKSKPGTCCVCRQQPGAELHHFGPRGLGQKGDDFLVARLCPDCHRKEQGKREAQYMRDGRADVWARIQGDALALLTGYVRELTAKNP